MPFRRRNQDRSAETTESPERGNVALAMVLVPAGTAITEDALHESYASLWPGRSWSPSPADDESSHGTLGVHIDGYFGAVSLMPMPVPDDLVDFAEHSWLWKGDVAPVAGHGGHVIVAVMGGQDVAARFAAATRLIAAVTSACDAVGVYVGGARMVVAADVYTALAKTRDPELSDLLWINTPAAVDEAGRASVATRGLETFGTLELEVIGSARSVGEVREFILRIAGYLAEHGPVIHDGNTVGGTATERYTVSVRPSVLDSDRQAMRIIGF